MIWVRLGDESQGGGWFRWGFVILLDNLICKKRLIQKKRVFPKVDLLNLPTDFGGVVFKYQKKAKRLALSEALVHVFFTSCLG